MRHQAGRPSPEQEAAFNHEDVVAVAQAISNNPDLRLVKLAANASLFRHELDFDAMYSLITPALFNDDQLGEVAQLVARHAVRIGRASSGDDRKRRRGALLERLVHELVQSRLPGSTHHEREIQLTHNPRSRRQWTHPKEVVAEGPEFEVYECKSDGLPDVADIDELSDVVTTARAEDTDARSTLVTFGSDISIKNMSRAWRLTEPIHTVSNEQIHELSTDAPNRPLPT